MIVGVTGLVFQSLLGFLMRCDNMSIITAIIANNVSIPIGFSDALRQHGQQPPSTEQTAPKRNPGLISHSTPAQATAPRDRQYPSFNP